MSQLPHRPLPSPCSPTKQTAFLRQLTKRGALFWLVVCIYPLSLVATPSGHSRTTRPTIRFAVVGDIMTHGDQVSSAYSKTCKCHQFRPVFQEVKPYLNKADYTIGNLETTLPGKRAGYSRNHSTVFGSPDSLADALKWAGFDLLVTANNHICDKGLRGISRTLRTLDRFKLEHFGAYHSTREYRRKRYKVLRIKGWRIAFLSYTTHANGCMKQKQRINLLYWPQVRKDIKRAKKQGFDAIIVHYHFGPEYVRVPSALQRGAVETALRAGANVVLGGHSHVIQPFYVYPPRKRYGKGNRLVAYSLGNFVSNIRRRYTDGGMILYFSLQRKQGHTVISKVSYEPVWVYKRPRDKQSHPAFYVLPVSAYQQGKGKWKLTKQDRREYQRFATDTKRHLQASMKQAKRYAP